MFLDLLTQTVLLFVVTAFLLKQFIKLAPRLRLVDIPNERSAHTNVTPRGAGIVFGAVFLAGLTFFNFEMISSYKLTAIALLIVYFTGIVDDIYNITSKMKFLTIIVATCFAYYDGFAITYLGTYLGFPLELGLLALPFTIFAVVGFTNAVNLTDGLDGLAASISVVILATIMYFGIVYHDLTLIFVPMLLISVLLAFLVFNWSPAKVFMGDSGSLMLGFVISLLAIKSLAYIHPIAILLLAGMPLLDTLIVMRRRVQRGQSPFKADKNHLHHILFNLKRDTVFAVKILVLLQICFSLMCVQIIHGSGIVTMALFLCLFVIFFELFDPRMSNRSRSSHQSKNS